jgi:regulator of sigma E protease
MLFVIIFIICLNILVFVHELGHFLVAKKNGLKVEEFGMGIPPRIFGIKKGETLYSLNALPIGGFVRIYGEDGAHPEEKNSFASRPPLTRAKILIAGIVMNLIFGIMLFIVGLNIGIPTVVDEKNIAYVKDIKLSVLQVQKDSPAEAVGIKMGDRILKISYADKEILNPSVEELQRFSKEYVGKEITMQIERGNKNLEIKITPRETKDENQGALGVVIGETGFLRYPFFKSVWEGIRYALGLFVNIFVMIFVFLKSLIFQGKMLGEVAGPVGITVLGSETLKLGIGYFLQFLATLSVYLAAINLVPFPALDGSRIVFAILEKIRGKAVPSKIENLIHSIGFVILLLIFFVITYKDIAKLF